eukprot:TRINITY_DN173_c0_g1_i5.p1 TRINITY_DN173_c0_g1~~TRINITY_DN173_c0_g1_i5.p1  ORF type:complete len:215 (-),score=34.98 TRINITY_DN173_c0_g1_i5:74-718(-)
MSDKAKVYYTPTSCGAVTFIAAHASGVPFESEQVDIRSHKTASGADFYEVNPKGNVPTVVLPGGAVTLDEGPACVQYFADQAPQNGLLAPVGSPERYVTIGDFNWVGTEFHKTVGILFNPTIDEAIREHFTKQAYAKLDFLENNLLKGGRPYLHGDTLTIADLYLYVALGWTSYVKLSLDKYPSVQNFVAGIKALPLVQEATQRMQAQTPSASS